MKHIPNIITLANLFFGCCAIVSILSIHPYLAVDGDYMRISGMENMYLGSMFIALAAVMDMLDGLAARTLNAHSPLGKDLDSLADVVSFGVAPAMIFYQLIWRSYMQEPNALQTPFLAMAPAFLIACFAALRLAIFNNSEGDQKYSFKGVPTPAIGLVIASLPLVLYFNFQALGHFLENRWILYTLIAIFCYLMVAPQRFFKWYATDKSLKAWLPQIIVAIALILGIIFFNYGGVIIAFFTYVIVSYFIKTKAHEV